MTGIMNTGGNQPMGMASTGAGESTGMGSRAEKPMGTMDGGGAKPSGARSGTSGDSKPMGVASSGDVQGNGGGPEPHQGSNPGAQSDPGPKEIGFYDAAGDHMGGDDGVQNAAERPSPMRMGGVGGSQPNSGQRGGQNTGTSGSQTTSQVGWRMAGTARSRMDSQQAGQEGELTGAKATSYSSEEEYGAGGASGVTDTHEPGHVDAMDTHEPGHTGAGTSSGAYQSRAAQRLATAESGSGATGARMDEPVEDFDSTPAARAGEMAEGAVEKTQGFFAKAKDVVEDFLNADMDGDGNVGSQGTQTPDTGSFTNASNRAGSETYGTGGTSKTTDTVQMADDWDQADDDWGASSAGTSYERDTPGTRPYNAGSATRVQSQQREKELTAA